MRDRPLVPGRVVAGRIVPLQPDFLVEFEFPESGDHRMTAAFRGNVQFQGTRSPEGGG